MAVGPHRFVLVLPLVLLLAWTTAAADEAPPSAAQVVVRGRAKLEDALEAAIGPAPSVEEGPSVSTQAGPRVLLVLDVTPYTALRGRELASALTALDARYVAPGRWRFARLGERPSRAFARPGQLGPVVLASLSRDTRVVATIPALAKTLKLRPRKGGRVVYLADWHFEDDVDLEKSIVRLRREGTRFSVVGSEAGFGRAWLDGFYPPDRGKDLGDGRRKMYAEGIGRSPFGPEDDEAPWHGGDTAWPHYPFHMGGTHWATKFPVELRVLPARTKKQKKDRYAKPRRSKKKKRRGESGDPEDLQGRLREKHAQGTVERYWFPLPSGFGPYALMRLCGVTGGRYVLFSWNPSGRTDVSYNYSRCNLFGPDLRPRKVIHADIRSRPLARAILKAWHEITDEDAAIANITPPLALDARKPRPMEETRGRGLPFHWDSRGEYEQFKARAPVHHAALARAIRSLEAGLAEPRKDDVDQRYEADARLLLHTLQTKHFQLGEAIAAALTLDVKAAWDRLPLHPGLDPEHFIVSRDKLDVPTGVELHDEEAGAALRAKRQAYRERFQGTPFGELVSRNPVLTYKLHWIGYARGNPAKESPGESGGKPSPGTPPPSGGAGPATGK